MASFLKDILFYISRIENDIEAVKQLINISENPGNEGVENRDRDCENTACSQVKKTNGHDSIDDNMSNKAEGSVTSVAIKQYSNEDNTGDLSDKSETDLKQMVEDALKTIENSAKKIEAIKEKLVTESNKTKVLKLKKKISNYSSIVEKMSSKIEEVKKELRSRKIETKKSVGTFVTNPAISAKVSSSAYVLYKRKHSESVVDCSLRRISQREEELTVLKKVKKEENPFDDSFKCNFCERSFVNAGQLAAHLEGLYSGNKQLFQCSQCPKKFNTMDMKMIHEKKHRPQVWGQCGTCLRFFKDARDGCSYCQK